MSSQYVELPPTNGRDQRSVGEFGAPQQISMGFASWLCYFCNLIKSIQQRVLHTFGWAAITLGIGPHFSLHMFLLMPLPPHHLSLH